MGVVLWPAAVWSQSSLKTGDKILFVGDSYIGQHGCTALVMDTVALHHPDADISFRTVSISHLAFASTGIPQAYIPPIIDSDILREKPSIVFLSFGLEKLPTKPVDTTGIFPRFFLKPLTDIATKCQAAGARLIFVTPGCLDLTKQPELEGTAAQENLTYYSKTIRDIAAKTQAEVVDLSVLMKDVLTRGRTAAPGFSLAQEGITLNQAGHTLVASVFLRALGEEGLTSELSIDATSGRTQSQHCTMRDLTIMDGVVTFTREDASLPAYFPPEGAAALSFDPTLKHQDRYLLTIRDLRDGKWRVVAGGVEVGTFTHAELATGINLAHHQGPWQRQAHGFIHCL